MRPITEIDPATRRVQGFSLTRHVYLSLRELTQVHGVDQDALFRALLALWETSPEKARNNALAAALTEQAADKKRR